MDLKKFNLSSFTLHILAMTFMLCDHLWATVLFQYPVLTWIGRLAYPIFAFMIVEGYHYTHDFKKYIKRLFIWAVITEIPFNLMYSGRVIYPFHQNVLWTFLIALLCIELFERIKKKEHNLIFNVANIKVDVITVLAGAGIGLLGFILGFAGMVDFYGPGVLTVFFFYLFRGKKWWQLLGQVIGMYIINISMLGGYYVVLHIFGLAIEFPQQAMAMFSLIFIWLYNGRQGPHNKTISFIFYSFYPLHCLILALMMLYL